jgi:type IV pilus assembly protein PilW
VTADIGSGGNVPTWTVVSDCRTSATAYSNARAPATGQLAFPIRRLVYGFNNGQLLLGSGVGNPTMAVLVDNVRAFNVTFGMAGSATDVAATSYSANPSDPALIRSVRLTLTLFDPRNTVREQTFNVVAALRNRLL